MNTPKTLGEARRLKAEKSAPKPKETKPKPIPLPEPEPLEPPPEDLSPADFAAYEAPLFDIDYATSHPEAELAARELSRRRLLPFIQRFRPSYDAGWVHADICRRLEKFVADIEAKKSPRLLLMMPVRHGKQLADSTEMLTTEGWTTHGQLKVGDSVFGPDGRAVKVLALSEKTPSDVVVTMSDGAQIRCHENHEWTVYQRSHSKWMTVETGFWLQNGRFGKPRQLKSAGRHIYQLPPVEPLQFAECTLPLHPYAFGAWLGDGTAGKTCITHHADEHEVIDSIESLGYEVSAVCKQVSPSTLSTYFGSGVPNVRSVFSQGLKETGAIKDKHIPLRYQQSSVAQRLELLAGLIDTDGSVDGKTGRVRIVTVSDVLRDDIMQLVRSFGMQVGCHTQKPSLSSSGIQGRRPTHYISFTPTLAIPTRLPRKKIVGKPREAVSIVSVERVVSGEEGRCIQVDSPDGLYLAGRNLTPTHNSEICSRHFPAWLLGKHPEWEIIAASGAQNLAMSFSRYARDLIRDPGYTAVFPNTRLDSSSQSVENWNILKGGGYLSAGIGTMITGRGATCLIIDDPVKDGQAADSPTVRENTWEWYMSTAYTRLAPGGGVLGILTWWNEDDWAGRVQQVMATGEGDVFEIVKYPAINEFGDEYLLPDDRIEQFPAPGLPPAGSRLLRSHNTALHPQRYPYDELMRKKANYCALGQKRWWDALFQQNPTPEDGDYFTPSMFKYYSTAPSHKDMHIYQAWDFAISTDQKNDYTVGTTVGVDHRGAVYVLDVRRFKSGDSIIISQTIVDYAKEYDPVLIGFEDGQIWRTMEAQFLRACDEGRVWPSYEVLKPLTDKLVRASPLRGQMQAGRVYFDKGAHWFGELYKEFLRFGAGGIHDDQVDSLAWVIRLTLSRAAPRTQREEPRMPSWKDKLSGFTRGSGSHMSA